MERTLSKNESKVVLDLEWREQKTLALSDLQAVLGCSDTYARYMAHQLVRKGWLERLTPGLFRLIPADRGREGVADTNPLAVGAVLTQPYFFSFGTACTHHGLTEQVFAEIYIACTQRRRSATIRETRFVFVDVGMDLFFGFEKTDVLGEPVQMATRGRALLDALDRPHLAGGLGEVSRMIARSGSKLSWDALVDLLRRWNESALVQRLGYLLDLHRVDVPAQYRVALESLVRQRSKVLLGPRQKWGTSGKLVSPWNIVENVPREELVEKGATSRRPIVFGQSEPASDR